MAIERDRGFLVAGNEQDAHEELIRSGKGFFNSSAGEPEGDGWLVGELGVENGCQKERGEQKGAEHWEVAEHGEGVFQ